MKRTIGLISVVVIAIALMIAFSGVALASSFAESTPEKQTIKTATKIVVWKINIGRSERVCRGWL